MFRGLGADCGGSCTTKVPWAPGDYTVPAVIDYGVRTDEAYRRSDAAYVEAHAAYVASQQELARTQGALDSCRRDYTVQVDAVERARTNTTIAIVGGTVVAIAAAWVSHKYWK